MQEMMTHSRIFGPPLSRTSDVRLKSTAEILVEAYRGSSRAQQYRKPAINTTAKTAISNAANSIVTARKLERKGGDTMGRSVSKLTSRRPVGRPSKPGKEKMIKANGYCSLTTC